jgi:adenine-specific DNA methylase
MARTRIRKRTLLEDGDLPFESLAELALREGQSTNPLFRVHRWFARRLSVQFRALLTAISLGRHEAGAFWGRFYGELDLSGLTVLDPFVGGGTSIIEAAHCGADVWGFDIDPVAAAIARFGLDLGAYERLPSCLEGIAQAVSRKVRPFHVTRDGEGRPVEVLHHFWVERRTCPDCGAQFDLHPHYQLAYDTQKDRQWVFCRACGEVHELPLERQRLHCRCGERTVIQRGPLRQGTVHCPACRSSEDLSARGRRSGEPPSWRLFAQEYLAGSGKRGLRAFKAADTEDLARFARAERSLRQLERENGEIAPSRAIPDEGRSDGRPLIHGFHRYRQLFNARQLLHLSLLARQVAEVEDPRDRGLIGLAFSDHLTSNCMYAAYAFGYRRISPLFSIHGYRHITRPVELNPWLDGIGRGTFPNALNKIRRAIQFAKAPSYLTPDRGRDWPAAREAAHAPPSVRRGRRDVRSTSSEDLSCLRDESIDLILTDPPYFDNVSYSELSDFYLSWHQAIGIAPPPYDDPARPAPIKENLAITDRSGASVEGYAARLLAILCECHRVLKQDGLCVFTYHHRSARAWGALGRALVGSGLKPTAVLPSRGEGQGGLHSYDGTIKWDAVLVCRKGARPEGLPSLVVSLGDIQRAASVATEFAARFSRTLRIGFRAPDRENLYRALVVARARMGLPSERALPLEQALQREPAAVSDSPGRKTADAAAH